jgi:DnaJ like chaperone protein
VAYWGKVTGTVAGLATGQPWLALAGLILGHQFDQGYASRRGTNDGAGRIDRLSPSFVSALFATMGHLAKSDGRVTEAEIQAARILMHRLALTPARVRSAIGSFEDGKKPGFALATTLAAVRRESASQPERKALFVSLLMEVSLAIGMLGRRERAAMWSVCSELVVGRVELAQLEAMLRAQKGFRRSPAGDADAERVRRAYAVLGVTQSASKDDIKTAYRRLMSRNHPDKLSGGDADVAALAAAQKRTREIRGAYDMLRARRSIR